MNFKDIPKYYIAIYDNHFNVLLDKEVY